VAQYFEKLVAFVGLDPAQFLFRQDRLTTDAPCLFSAAGKVGMALGNLDGLCDRDPLIEASPQTVACSSCAAKYLDLIFTSAPRRRLRSGSSAWIPPTGL
jgi:hypothetical protein